MVVIKKWYVAEGERKPTIECPQCGFDLIGDAAPHGIKSDGTIHKSVVCGRVSEQFPNGCNFHDHVKLDGWYGGDIPHR